METKKFESEYYISAERDYLNYVTKTSTKEQRIKFDIGDIFINAIACRSCGDYIRSKNRHDFKRCNCGKIAVDGGSWYLQRIGTDYIECSESFYDVENEQMAERSNAPDCKSGTSVS